ncbi:cholinephosphate cytidylyltransferase [Agrocybe pediades]|nr:cholinephosphate cytidylyltransferase [Agrocybe pediades]
METSSVLSDDEYDIISEPGRRLSLDSSCDYGFDHFELREPPPSADAQDRFESTRWSANEVQQYIQKSLAPGLSLTETRNRKIRIYVDGPFDDFDVGAALKLRQAKMAFPSVHLIVGVFSDETLQQNDYMSTRPGVERAEIMRHCRWVDEVIKDAPWELTCRFLKDRAIDFVALDEGTSVDPSCHKARVRAYDELQKHGKVIKTRRTVGLVSQLPRLLIPSPSPSQRATPTLTFSRSLPNPSAESD